MMDDRFSVLTVCTGNVHRSPLAAALLTRWAEWYLPGDLAPLVSVSSAGLGAVVGAPMDQRVLALARALGADGSSHRGAQVNDRLLSDADLVLVASRRQFEAVLGRVPAAVRRVFTMREAGRIAQTLSAVPPKSVRDLQRIVERLADSRVAAVDGADDDVIDPQGLGDAAYVQMAQEEIPALAWLGSRLFGMPRADLTAYLAAPEYRERLLGTAEAPGREA